MQHEISYVEMLLTELWKRKREEILERDNRKCRNCGSTHDLQIHHKQYHIDSKTGFKKEPWKYEDKYLITLCRQCHETGHNQYIIPVFTI